jgi:Bacterial regulatory helix-turn-helix protein, lysR family
MEIRQLRYFVAVARERNFTLAAARLHIAQAPLSRQMRSDLKYQPLTLAGATSPIIMSRRLRDTSPLVEQVAQLARGIFAS